MKFILLISKRRRSVAEDTVDNVDRRGFVKDVAFNIASSALQRTVYGPRSTEDGDELFDRDLLEDSDLERRAGGGVKSFVKSVARDAAFNAASGALQRATYGRRSILEEAELLEREFEDILDDLD